MVKVPTYVVLDGPEGQCGLGGCGGRTERFARETLVDGRIEWFYENVCTRCGQDFLYCGRGRTSGWVRETLLEQTGSWVATIDSADPAPVSVVMRGLRKVYGCTIAEARTMADAIREDGLPGTHGEALFIQHEFAALGVAVVIANTVPGTLRQLPERPVPAPPHLIGSEPDLTVNLEPGAIDEPERPRVAGYLREAGCVVATAGFSVDPITRDPRDRIYEALMTDGVYIWSVAWATLVQRHGVAVPADFLAHVRDSGYRPPQLTTEQFERIGADLEATLPR